MLNRFNHIFGKWLRPLAILITFLLSVLPSFKLFAQDSLSRDTSVVTAVRQLDYFQSGILGFSWHGTNSPIALLGSDVPDYAITGIEYKSEQGGFRKRQAPVKAGYTGFGAEGANGFKGWRFFGRFSYERFSRQDVNFANTARPLDGNPFIIADSIGGDWKGDVLNASLQILYPSMRKWRLATSIDYLGEQGNRQNDPRPLYRFLDMALHQSFSYQLNTDSRLEVRAGFQRLTEDVETGKYTVSRNFKLYSLRGVGSFDFVPVVLAERYKRGRGFSSAVNYYYNSVANELYLGAAIAGQKQDLTEGNIRNPATDILEPFLIGQYRERNYRFYVGFQRRKSAVKGWSIRADAQLTDGEGYDPRFSAINPSSSLVQFHAEFSLWTGVSSKRIFKFSYMPSWSRSELGEIIAKSTVQSAVLGQQIGVTFFGNLNRKTSMAIEPLLGYYFPTSGYMFTGNPTAISALLIIPDYSYNTQSFIKTGTTASLTLKADKLTCRLLLGYLRQSSQDLGHRDYVQTGLQLLF